MKTTEEIALSVAATYHESIRPAAYSAAHEAITADRAQRSYYLLSFEPDAIRDHFEADEIDPTEGMTDEQLEAVALDALQDDRLYAVFHHLLSEGVGA